MDAAGVQEGPCLLQDLEKLSRKNSGQDCSHPPGPPSVLPLSRLLMLAF